jgi:hypothetical protein
MPGDKAAPIDPLKAIWQGRRDEAREQFEDVQKLRKMEQESRDRIEQIRRDHGNPKKKPTRP